MVLCRRHSLSTIYHSIISQSTFCNRIICLNTKSVKLRNPKNPIDEAIIFHKIWLSIDLKIKIIDIAHIGKLIQKAILVLLNFSALSSEFILSGFNYYFIIKLQRWQYGQKGIAENVTIKIQWNWCGWWPSHTTNTLFGYIACVRPAWAARTLVVSSGKSRKIQINFQLSKGKTTSVHFYSLRSWDR